MNDDTARQIASLRKMMAWPSKQHIIDIVQRRIFALENEIVYTNPFGDIDETLYAIWRGLIPAPIVMTDSSAAFGEIDWDDFR